jgi:phenylalanyl-tRNA synthetase alpha subunit
VPKCTQQTQHTQQTQLSFEELIRKQKEEFDAKLKELSEKEEHKEMELEQLKEKLKQTENELHIERKKEHSPQISNTINQNITNITIYQVMTPEHVLDVFQKHYSIDTLLGGQKALARFVHDGFLKESPVYVCGDRSRQKFYIVKE